MLIIVSGFLFQPLLENVQAKIIFNEPVEQLPSINNIGVPYFGYSEILVRDSIAYCNHLVNEIVVFDFSNPKERILLGNYS